MTSVEIGCPYGPCRKKQSSDTVNRTFCRYHQPSIHVLHSSHVTKACEKRDQEYLHGHKEECTNYRDDSEEIRKNRTYGILASYHPCGVAIGYTEAVKAEGMRSITRHLLRMIIYGCRMPDALMHDCACTLKLHWNKWFGIDMLKLSNLTKQLPTSIALDNFHQRTHTRAMCKTIMASNHPSHEGRFIGLNS
ncbi:unnamed protein product [Rotaria magnacalcarata]|uniref:Uncharacterized protein n=1 Tax=Rotaria magnacalcarata TaxID=392030 RepID=A0A8S3GW51_9BILA|nr:unnamed protein product [Rotaria magnacalcarata]